MEADYTKKKGSVVQIATLVVALGSTSGLASYAALKSIDVAENNAIQNVRIDNLAVAVAAATITMATLDEEMTGQKIDLAIIKEYSRLMAESQLPVINSNALEKRVTREVASSSEPRSSI